MSQTPILHALSVALGVTDTAPDAELLQRFTAAGDRTAFELVVRRHADLVWGVCRAVLPGDTHTAEDAFQATFLALARKADSIRDGSAAGWLFRVARNAAGRARTRAARCEVCVLPDALASTEASVEEEAARHEVAPVVAEEVDRLGATLRDPVVLCFFEGHTHAEAANRLGWPIGTVASRLARAKNVLRDRLTRRGVALPAAGLAAVLAPASAPASPLVRSALVIATGPANQISPTVLSLTQGVLWTMRFTHIKSVAAVVAVAVGLTAAVAAVPRNAPAPARDGAVPLAARNAAPVPKDKPTAKELEARELKALKGEWRVVKLETDQKNERELAALRFAFTGNRLAISSGNEDENENCTIGLIPTEYPRHIDLTIENPEKGELDAGKIARGIYELKGDTLTLCVRHLAADDARRPTAFKSGEGLVLTVLERVKDEKEELKALAGEWKAVKVIALGQEVAAAELAKRKMMWFFDGAEMLMTGEGEKGDKATIKLDPSAAPATIDLIGKDDKGTESKLPGIYFRQGDKLTVCYAHQALPPQKMGKDPVRPTELKAVDGVVFIVFERAPKK